jgi:hypothetical protein
MRKSCAFQVARCQSDPRSDVFKPRVTSERHGGTEYIRGNIATLDDLLYMNSSLVSCSDPGGRGSTICQDRMSVASSPFPEGNRFLGR